VLARERERLLIALADLLRRHALLQPVVSGDEQVVNLLAGLVLIDARKLAAWGPRG
jgi:hypothetical protein